MFKPQDANLVGNSKGMERLLYPWIIGYGAPLSVSGTRLLDPNPALFFGDLI